MMKNEKPLNIVLSNILKNVFAIILFLSFMFPFFLVIINAFKTKSAIIENPLSLFDPKGITFSNFISAFKEMNYVSAFLNSTMITFVSVICIFCFSSMAAYIFARTKWFASKLSFALMVGSMVIPFQVIMIPLVSIYGNQLNMLNNRATLIFMHIGFGMSLATFMYHGFIKSGVPITLEEAAKLDGCTRFQTFYLIVFPLLKSTTATIVILNVLGIWNDFLLPSLILGKKALFTLPLSTYSFYGTYSKDLGKIMAGLLMTAFPVIIVYIFMQKHIISGITSGAVKS